MIDYYSQYSSGYAMIKLHSSRTMFLLATCYTCTRTYTCSSLWTVGQTRTACVCEHVYVYCSICVLQCMCTVVTMYDKLGIQYKTIKYPTIYTNNHLYQQPFIPTTFTFSLIPFVLRSSSLSILKENKQWNYSGSKFSALELGYAGKPVKPSKVSVCGSGCPHTIFVLGLSQDRARTSG